MANFPTTIYALLDCVGTVRYVGKTVSLCKRVGHHRRTKPWYAGHLVLEVIPPGGDWRAAERRHIEEWNRWGDLENVRNGGDGNEKHSAETRAKISAANKGKHGGPLSAEHRARISAATKGRLGRPHSLETRAKMSASAKARVRLPHTSATRAKMSAAAKGKTKSPEHRAKLSAAHMGKTLSPEHRAKLSAVWAARRASQRQEAA